MLCKKFLQFAHVHDATEKVLANLILQDFKQFSV